MFFTITMLLVSCVNTAPLISRSRSTRLPEVRNSIASATRFGVRTKPSRAGSSPISISSCRINDSILARSSFMALSLNGLHRLARIIPRARSARTPKAQGPPGWEYHNGREIPICEGVSTMGKMIELIAADGFRLSAYRAEPEGGPRGGVVVAQEIFGVNSHIKSVCDGFARDGYVAIAPALFDRYERNVDIGYTADDIA